MRVHCSVVAEEIETVRVSFGIGGEKTTTTTTSNGIFLLI